MLCCLGGFPSLGKPLEPLIRVCLIRLIIQVIWSTCWPLLVEVLSMMFFFIFVGWGHCWCFSWLLASCACVSWLCSSHFLFFIWIMLILLFGFIVDVCLAMFPIVQSPLWLATLLHFGTGWFHLSVVGLGPLFLQVEACSPCSFLRSRVIRCECNEFEISPMRWYENQELKAGSEESLVGHGLESRLPARKRPSNLVSCSSEG